MEDNQAPIKSYSIGELAHLYGFTVPTIKKWLGKIPNLEARTGRFFNPNQVKKIFEHCGAPDIAVTKK